jgi:hypothetical protein
VGRRRRVAALAFLAALLAIGFRSWRTAPRTVDLLAGASLLNQTKGRGSGWWLDDGSYLWLEYPRGGVTSMGPVPMRVTPGREGVDVQPRLPPDTRIVGPWRHRPISPDGRYWVGPHGSWRWLGGSLDGKLRREWPSLAGTHLSVALWFPDSRRWLEVSFEPRWLRLRVFSLDSRRHTVQWRLAALAGPAQRGLRILGISPDERLICLGSRYDGTTDLVSLDLRTGRLRQAPLPLAWLEAADITLSFQGDRLAWHTHPTRSPWLAGLARALDLPEPLTFTLWTCRTDGSGLRRVGHWTVAQERLYVHWSAGLEWLPDGQRVSLWHEDALWVVPVPREEP